MDEASGLVRQAEMTSANVHDSRLGEALIQGDEQGFFADRAYDSQALRETLERRGLVDGIAWKVKHARYPLETWQKLHNAWATSVRSAVERAFATMKRWYGMGRVRYLGLARNACHLQVRRHGDEHEAGARADERNLNGGAQTNRVPLPTISQPRAEQRQKPRARLFARPPPEPNHPITTKSDRYAKLSTAKRLRPGAGSPKKRW